MSRQRLPTPGFVPIAPDFIFGSLASSASPISESASALATNGFFPSTSSSHSRDRRHRRNSHGLTISRHLFSLHGSHIDMWVARDGDSGHHDNRGKQLQLRSSSFGWPELRSGPASASVPSDGPPPWLYLASGSPSLTKAPPRQAALARACLASASAPLGSPRLSSNLALDRPSLRLHPASVSSASTSELPHVGLGLSRRPPSDHASFGLGLPLTRREA